jgi:hypothetical protein
MSKSGQATAQNTWEVIPRRPFDPVFSVGNAKFEFSNR